MLAQGREGWRSRHHDTGCSDAHYGRGVFVQRLLYQFDQLCVSEMLGLYFTRLCKHSVINMPRMIVTGGLVIILSFLEYLHEKNCVHRDLKPANW